MLTKLFDAMMIRLFKGPRVKTVVSGDDKFKSWVYTVCKDDCYRITALKAAIKGHPLAAVIDWPNLPTDVLDRTIYMTALHEFVKCSHSGFFNVSPLQTMIGLGLIKHAVSSREMAEVNRVHCLHYKNMNSDYLLTLPGKINALFDHDRTQFLFDEPEPADTSV